MPERRHCCADPLLQRLHARPPWRKAIVVERRRVVVEEAAMLVGARRRRAGLLLRVRASSRKQRPSLGKEEAASRKEEMVPSKRWRCDVAEQWRLTTSRHGSVIVVRGRAAVPPKSVAVPSKVEEASM
jgi:hypothetical protein